MIDKRNSTSLSSFFVEVYIHLWEIHVKVGTVSPISILTTYHYLVIFKQRWGKLELNRGCAQVLQGALSILIFSYVLYFFLVMPLFFARRRVYVFFACGKWDRRGCVRPLNAYHHPLFFFLSFLFTCSFFRQKKKFTHFFPFKCDCAFWDPAKGIFG